MDLKFDHSSEEFEPEESDAFFDSSGPLGTLTTLHYNERFIGEFKTLEEAEEALRCEAEKSQFWPNVWSVSDHGNYHLIKGFDWNIKKESK